MRPASSTQTLMAVRGCLYIDSGSTRRAPTVSTSSISSSTRKRTSSSSSHSLSKQKALATAQTKKFEHEVCLLVTAVMCPDTSKYILPTGYAPIRERARAAGMVAHLDSYLITALVDVMWPPQTRIEATIRTLLIALDSDICSVDVLLSAIAQRFRSGAQHVWAALLDLCVKIVPRSSVNVQHQLASALMAALASLNADSDKHTLIPLTLNLLDTLTPSSSSTTAAAITQTDSNSRRAVVNHNPKQHHSLIAATTAAATAAENNLSSVSKSPPESVSNTSMLLSDDYFISAPNTLIARHHSRKAFNTTILTQEASRVHCGSYTLHSTAKISQLTSSTDHDVALWTFVSLLSERTPMEILRAQVQCNNSTQELRSRTLLCEALAIRVLTLLLATTRSRSSKRSSGSDVSRHLPSTSSIQVSDDTSQSQWSSSFHTSSMATSEQLATTPLSSDNTLTNLLTPSVLTTPYYNSHSSTSFTPQSASTPIPSDARVNNTNQSSILQAWEGSWGEWLILADQCYALLQCDLIGFSEFILTLEKIVPDYCGTKRICSNTVVWLITQCMPIERVKKEVSNDLSKNGKLTKSLVAFYDVTSREMGNSIEIADSSIACLLWRIRSIRKEFRVPESMNHADTMHEQYGRWWSESQSSSLDFYSLDENAIVKLVVLSNISSQAVADRITLFLNDDAGDSDFAMGWPTLPGQLVVTGRTKPLSTVLLVNLSTQCRSRLAASIQQRIFDAPEHNGASRITPPGLVETFVRLLYIAPYALSSMLSRVQMQLRQTDRPISLHTTLEMINFRLFRLFRHQQFMLNRIFQDLVTLSASTTRKQLFDSVQNLQLKIALATPILIFEDIDAPLSPFILRAMLIGFARALTSIRSSLMSNTVNAVEAFVRLYSQHNPRPIAASQRHFLPPVLRDRIDMLMSNDNIVSFPTIHQATMNSQRDEVIGLLSFNAVLEDVEKYLKSSRIARQNFLCAIAMLWLQQQSGFIEYEHNFQRAVRSLSPQDLLGSTYAFADFILFAVKTEEIPLDVASALVVQFTWTSKLISVDTLVLALSEYDDDDGAMELISALLLCQEFALRIETLDNNHFDTAHWRNHDFLSGHIEYHTSFLEISVYDSTASGEDNAILPVYYGNLCAKMMPTLDIVLGRALECNRPDLIHTFVNAFRKLYQVYHYGRVCLVRDLFLYYNECTALTSTTKRILLRLCVDEYEISSEKLLFSSIIVRYASSGPDIVAGGSEDSHDAATMSEMKNDQDTYLQAFKKPQYLQSIIFQVAQYLKIVSNGQDNTGDKTSHFFLEFISSFDEALSCSITELLASPLSREVLVQCLLDSIILCPLGSTHSTRLRASSSIASSPINVNAVIAALAVVLRQMPLPFIHISLDSLSNMVFEYSCSFVCPVGTAPECIRVFDCSQSNVSMTSCLPFAVGSTQLHYTSTCALLGNPHLHLLNVVHHFLLDNCKAGSSEESFLSRFLSSIRSTIFKDGGVRNAAQLFYIVRTFAPFLSQSHRVIDDAYLLIMESLVYLARDILELHLIPHLQVNITDIPHCRLLEAVCDFFSSSVNQNKERLCTETLARFRTMRSKLPLPITPLVWWESALS